MTQKFVETYSNIALRECGGDTDANKDDGDKKVEPPKQKPRDWATFALVQPLAAGGSRRGPALRGGGNWGGGN